MLAVGLDEKPEGKNQDWVSRGKVWSQVTGPARSWWPKKWQFLGLFLEDPGTSSLMWVDTWPCP